MGVKAQNGSVMARNPSYHKASSRTIELALLRHILAWPEYWYAELGP